MKRKPEEIKVILPAASSQIGTDKESGFARRACGKIFSGFFRDGPTSLSVGMILLNRMSFSVSSISLKENFSQPGGANCESVATEPALPCPSLPVRQAGGRQAPQGV